MEQPEPSPLLRPSWLAGRASEVRRRRRRQEEVVVVVARRADDEKKFLGRRRPGRGKKEGGSGDVGGADQVGREERDLMHVKLFEGGRSGVRARGNEVVR